MESCVRLRAQSGVGLRESLPPSFCSWPSYSCAHAHFQAQKNSVEITGFLGGWSSWWIRERVEWGACEDMVLLQQALMCIHALPLQDGGGASFQTTASFEVFVSIHFFIIMAMTKIFSKCVFKQHFRDVKDGQMQITKSGNPFLLFLIWCTLLSLK